MNHTVAAAKLPLHERGQKLEDLSAEAKRSKNPITRLLLAAFGKRLRRQ